MSIKHSPSAARRPSHRLARVLVGLVVVGALALGPLLPVPAATALEAERTAAGDLRLVLGPELATTWDRVTTARLELRRRDGQVRLPSVLLPEADHLDLAAESLFADGGCAVVLADLAGLEAAWDREARRRGRVSTKVVACAAVDDPVRALEQRLEAAALATAKTGARTEIRPLTSPTLLGPGSTLPVRLYADGASRPGALVSWSSPGGSGTAVADSRGVALVPVDAAGPWRLTTGRRADDGTELAGELLFDVAPAAFWHRAGPGVLRELSLEAPMRSAALGVPDGPSGRWRPEGPAPFSFEFFAGRVASLATSAHDPDRWVAGTASGGVWTTEGGAAWETGTDALPTLAVGAVAFDPRQERVIYAGSGEPNQAYHSLYGLGLYRSENGGRTWRVLAEDVFAGRTVAALAVAPDGTVFAGRNRAGGSFGRLEGAREHPLRDGPLGLVRSRDGGRTWQTLALPDRPVMDVELDPTDADVVYAVVADPFGSPDNGVYRSTDGGDSFVRLAPGLPWAGAGRIDLALAPSDPSRLYAFLAAPMDRLFPGGFFPGGAVLFGFWSSNDGGATWSLRSPDNILGAQGAYNLAVEVDPTDPDVVFLGGVLALRSDDGGATFADVTPPHVDIHDFTFDAAGRLLAATDGGVFLSPDRGESWSFANDGLGNLQFYAGIDATTVGMRRLVGGLQDNGVGVRLPGFGWFPLSIGDGGFTDLDPRPPGDLLFDVQGAGLVFQWAGDFAFFRFAGVGIDPSDRTAFQAPLVRDPRNPDRILYATQRIWETTDNATTWAPISGDVTAGAPFAVRSMVLAPSDPDVIWGTTNGDRVIVSTDGGASWTTVLEGVAGWPRIMRQVTVDPVDARRAWVADARFGGGVRATEDLGATWTSVGGNLPDRPVNTVTAHRGASGTLWLFAGTDAGVFVSVDGAPCWGRHGRGLPAAPVTDLLVDEDFGLLASTLGRGVWSLELPTVATPGPCGGAAP